MMMTSRSPLKKVDVCLVGTRNYLFAVPMKTVGMYVMLTTFKTHQFFQDVSIPEGVQRVIQNAQSVEEL
jgi:hypothetical protein